MTRKILYIAPALPVLTCTFIYREIFDLREMGFEIDTISMNTPAPDRISSEAMGLLRTTLYLDQVPERRKLGAFIKTMFNKPLPMLRCLGIFFTARPMQSFQDYRRLGYHLIEACYLSYHLQGSKPDHIHSHFIAGATSINMFLSELIGVPFSFTMHASAIWIDPIALKTKLGRCTFCVSISEYNMHYVLDEYGQEWRPKFNIVHCGIPVADYNQARLKAMPQGSGAVNVLAVGQLMVRKGYLILIEAARILRDGNANVLWTIVGEGYQRPVLEQKIREYELGNFVILEGAKPHEDIPQFLANADIFTLPCIIGDDKTRDGIPVSLMEAMAWQLPVVSTNIVGLPELIDSGSDGILVESGNAMALADAIQELADSPELRQRIATAAADKIDREFNSVRSARQLGHLFEDQ